uniref:Uncharacterized protein n=1 Tax=Cacopsylla melanoneura TaxID=428564 RepID=A0A8D8WAK1_9HEMI
MMIMTNVFILSPKTVANSVLAQIVDIDSSEPSAQWFTLSQMRSVEMQNSSTLQLNSAHECLGSLKAVMTSLNPLASVPQLSVTYFNVTKLVRVKIAPTSCFVFLQVMSAL